LQINHNPFLLPSFLSSLSPLPLSPSYLLISFTHPLKTTLHSRVFFVIFANPQKKNEVLIAKDLILVAIQRDLEILWKGLRRKTWEEGSVEEVMENEEREGEG